ncbi:unnamed protein product [Effrenium voratum]|nr:unnamed protein product [Effrenium voratum]
MDVTIILGIVAAVCFCCLAVILLACFPRGWQLHLQPLQPEIGELELQGEACAICLESIQLGVQLSCGHAFHKMCIRQWWRRHLARACPMCRQTHMAKQM